jgi:predicted ATP-grasp superfamily ATP-dependent carboligase
MEGGEGKLTLPAEVYFSAERKLTALVIRSGPLGGRERAFGKELKQFVKSNGFARVVILSSTMSPVSRERDTNRL